MEKLNSANFVKFSLFYLLLVFTQASSRRTYKPKMVIAYWLGNEEYKLKPGNELEDGLAVNETVFFIPNDVNGLVLQCTADYPVLFEFEPLLPTYKINEFGYGMQSVQYRISPNMQDTPGFKYGAAYFIYGSSAGTGNYICKRASDGTTRSNMHIFWEGVAPPYFLEHGSTQTATTHKANGKISLPCILSVRDDEVELNLLKEMNMTNDNNKTSLEFVPLNPDKTNFTIGYDAFQGYVLTYGPNITMEGRYKCITEEMDDYVIVNVVSDPIQKKPPHRDVLVGAASFHYDEVKSVLTCCSNSKSPPKTLSLSCYDPHSCDDAIVHLEDTSNALYWGDIADGNCVHRSLYGGLSALQFRCLGDGIDVIRRIIFSAELKLSNGTAYYDAYASEKDIIPDHLVDVSAEMLRGWNSMHPWNADFFFYFLDSMYMSFDGKYYAGRNVTFRCRTSSYYFSGGAKLTVRLNNVTDSMIADNKEFNLAEFLMSMGEYYASYSARVSLILDSSMSSVTCHAPIRNSRQWIKKTFDFKVIEPVMPSFDGPNEEDVYWDLGSAKSSQQIECKVSGGDPHPTLNLTKHGKQILSDSNMILTMTNTTITLKFLNATYNVHGNYECSATNLKGIYRKTFHVFVGEPHPWTATIIIISITVGLLALIGFVIWRIKLQRSTISDIRRGAGLQVEDANTIQSNSIPST